MTNSPKKIVIEMVNGSSVYIEALDDTKQSMDTLFAILTEQGYLYLDNRVIFREHVVQFYVKGDIGNIDLTDVNLYRIFHPLGRGK